MGGCPDQAESTPEKLGTGSSGLAGAVPLEQWVQLERVLASSGAQARALCVLEPASSPLQTSFVASSRGP